MRVVLVRHGASAHPQGSGSIVRAQVLEWRKGYDAAGIRSDSVPPPALVQVAADATHIIASDLPRAIASAYRLAPRRNVQLSQLFRETHLPIPHWPTALPLSGWEKLLTAAWLGRILLGVEVAPAEREQAMRASAWLTRVVPRGATAVVVTHGVFRRTLAKFLVRNGWASVERRGGFEHWSSWTLSKRD